MATLTPEDLSALVLDINAEEVKKELLSKYPTKVARKRAKQIVVNEVGPDSCVPEIAVQRPDHPRHHHPAGLHLRRLQGRGAGPHPGYRQHHPRPHRLRLLLLADPPQPDPAPRARKTIIS